MIKGIERVSPIPEFMGALNHHRRVHVRYFCTEDAWPRGDLNFPRALVPTKAFPEAEAVFTVIATDGVITNKLVYDVASVRAACSR